MNFICPPRKFLPVALSMLAVGLGMPLLGRDCPSGISRYTVGPSGRYATLNAAFAAIGDCLGSARNEIYLETGFHLPSEPLRVQLAAGDLAIVGGWRPDGATGDAEPTTLWARQWGERTLVVELAGLARFSMLDLTIGGGRAGDEGGGLLMSVTDGARSTLTNVRFEGNGVDGGRDFTLRPAGFPFAGAPGELKGGAAQIYVGQAANLSLDRVVATKNFVTAGNGFLGPPGGSLTHLHAGGGISITSLSYYASIAVSNSRVADNFIRSEDAASPRAGTCRGAGVAIDALEEAPPSLIYGVDGRVREPNTGIELFPLELSMLQRVRVEGNVVSGNWCSGFQQHEAAGLSFVVRGNGDRLTDSVTQMPGTFPMRLLVERNTFTANHSTGEQSDGESQLFLGVEPDYNDAGRLADRMAVRSNVFDGASRSRWAMRLRLNATRPGTVFSTSHESGFAGLIINNTFVNHTSGALLLEGIIAPPRLGMPTVQFMNNIAGTGETVVNRIVRTGVERADPTPTLDARYNCAVSLWLDAASGDYRSAAGSPAIDAGIGLMPEAIGTFDRSGVRARWRGGAPDCGAYEY